jgi:hypothetical protein
LLLKEMDTPEIPLFTPSSDIMNKEVECLLYLSNEKLNKVNTNLNLIYSNTKHGSKIEDMTEAMSCYEGDVLWLFKHIASEDDKRAGKPPIAVFGVWTTVVPEANGTDTTDKDCYLFSLIPTFKCLYPIKFIHKVCNNYLCGDSSFGKKGLGFGRDQKTKEFRIWIDEKYSTGSKLNNADDVFGKEHLIDGVTSLRVIFLVLIKQRSLPSNVGGSHTQLSMWIWPRTSLKSKIWKKLLVERYDLFILIDRVSLPAEQITPREMPP